MTSAPTDFAGTTFPNATRRTVLALLGATTVAGLLPRTAGAQDDAPPASERPRPSVDARFPAEIAPGVFLLPDRRVPLVPNIGIVVGTERALIVDCGLGLDSAEAVLDVARRLAPGRELILTVTHAHPEHGLGAQVFRRDARIVYNAAQRDHLMRTGQTLLDGFRAVVLPPEHRDLLDGIEITGPHETYGGASSTLDLGGREAVLHNVGTAHSPGDQLIHLPDAGIVFTGDLVEERIYPIVPFFPPMIEAGDIDLPRWHDALADIAALDPRLLVPGHGALGGPEIASAVDGYLTAVEEIAASEADLPVAEAELRRRYPTWEHPEYIAPALRYARR